MKEKLTLLKDSETFQVGIYGWILTTPPPMITGNGHFAPTPTLPVPIQNSNSQIIKKQTVTPSNQKTDNLSIVVNKNTILSPDGSFWQLHGSGNGVIGFILDMRLPVDVTLSIQICAVNDLNAGPDHTGYAIDVNGKRKEKLSIRNNNWHWETYIIKSDDLNVGKNSINIVGASYQGIWLKAITVSTENVKVSASYYWKQIASGLIYPKNKFKASVTYSSGNVTSDEHTVQMAHELGVKIKVGGIEKLLYGLGGELSYTFTHTSTNSHKVEISKQTELNYEVNIESLTDNHTTTFQIWQLYLQYTANNQAIDEAVPLDTSPFIIREYPSVTELKVK